MSRALSLCSQRCASGRLTRCLHWLEKECEHGSVCGVMEVRLALDIIRALCIGCGCGDQLDALTTLSSLSIYDDKSEDHGKYEKMKGRALACTAFFLRREKELAFLNHPQRMKDELNRGNITYSSLQERLDITSTQSTLMLTQAAEIGDPFALFNLAVCYGNGDGVSKDKKKAIELCQRAADMGNVDAMNKLGLCYDEGDGVSQDKQKAIELYQRAADMGNTNAMAILAVCYKKEGVSQDKQKAIELFQRAADMGNIYAMVFLGDCYDFGDCASQDFKKAFELYQKAAVLGNTRAMFLLGVYYDNGYGVPQDFKKAIELLQ